MNRIRKMAKRGFTLVELMIVVAIVGVLAALAIYGVRKYIANAKTAEAKNSLGQMGKDAQTAFAREGMSASLLQLGESTTGANRLCQSVDAPGVPDDITKVKGQKYQSSPLEWETDPTSDGLIAGWSCLKFSMEAPQYYQYEYVSTTNTGLVGDDFTAFARGDLDGDDALSTFSLEGLVEADADGNLLVKVSPTIKERLPEE